MHIEKLSLHLVHGIGSQSMAGKKGLYPLCFHVNKKTATIIV